LHSAENHKDRQLALERRFSDVFRQYEQPLHTLAYRLTKSNEAASDIIQDVFMKLWEIRDRMNDIQNMESWLYRVTENKVIDSLRKAASDRRLREKIWSGLQQIVDDTEPELASREYEQIIRKAIEGLPTQRKLIYRMNKEKGLSYQQIADELNISRHTVKNQLFTAVQSVKRFLTRSSRFFCIFF
jgi:RNA polymerase sigma-70 factor (ECF subfamily)